MYRRILVALGRDDVDAHLVDHARSLALLTGGQITLVHVVHSHSRDEAVFLVEQARLYLARFVDQLRGAGLQADSRVVQAEAAAGIAALGRELSADLLVMGTHGHSEIRHLFVGSVTEDVIRSTDRPVLLVSPNV
jgi:nucleotide-binding universal stress UspA family protein